MKMRKTVDQKMRAWTYERYGKPDEVLDLREVDVPTVGDDQVLVRVKAASVNPLDWHWLTGTPRLARIMMGIRRPRKRVPGADVAGIVEAIGKDVTRFRPGDEVFGETVAALAEYAVVSEDGLVAKPSNLTFEEAAAVPVAALTALQGLRDWGGMKAGDRVLINGASGGVGTFAVQIAQALGASEVTGVCSTRNAQTAKELGADRVIDYTREDFTRTGNQYDVVFDGPGNRSLRDLRRILAPGAVHVLIGGPKGGWVQPFPFLLKMKVAGIFFDFKAANDTAERKLEDLETLRSWLESGEVRPVIDRNYKLDEALDALIYQGEFHATGKVVVTV
jgi:NADPH:quinone reductase-like Zn-dependent oxidoreductase